MREILFKILDAETKKLIGYERINQNGHWEHKRDNRKFWLLGSITSEQNLIRLQYTGSTDKNGVKIFEFDIIAVDRTAYHLDFNEVVVFKNTQFTPDSFLCMSLDEVSEVCKVIGNKFDNPELLKE